MLINGENRSPEQFRRCVLELIALRGSAFAKWSVPVEEFALSPLPRHLEIDVIHDTSFRGARPFFVCGDKAFQNRQQKSSCGLVQKARGRIGRWIQGVSRNFGS